MNRRILQILFLAISVVMLGYGILFERHEVRSLSTDQPQILSGRQFVTGTTTDDFLRREQRLYDSRSLLPSWSSIKDCKT